jgi:hypothetical protein
MQNLSKYMSYNEAVRSNTAERLGIDNTPTDYQLNNMRFVASEVFDKVREFVDGPLTCSSFLRVKALNRAIGSGDTSFHVHGGAIDIKNISTTVTNAQIFDFIRCNLEFSELIWEYGTDTEPAWVHVAYLEGDNRKMVKRAYKVNGVNRVTKFDLY